MRRVSILGASGSGKSTFGAMIADRLGAPFIELDALYHGPSWSHPSDEEFRAKIAPIVSRDTWVIDGNYTGPLGDLVVRAADTIVWIDLPLRTTLARLARRSIRRFVFRTPLWNGNRESLAGLFLGREALFPWAISRHRRFREEMPRRFRTDFSGKSLHRFTSQREMDAWLATVAADATASLVRA